MPDRRNRNEAETRIKAFTGELTGNGKATDRILTEVI